MEQSGTTTVYNAAQQFPCPPSPPIASLSLSQQSNNTNTSSLAMRIQRKVLGKLSNRGIIFRHFAADRTIHLMDNLYMLLNQFYPSKTAEKIVKNILKVTLKIGIQCRDLDEEQKRKLDKMEGQFRGITLTILSFQTIAFSYDREFLLIQLNDLKQIVLSVAMNSLSEKSEDRIEHIFQHLSQPEMLDSIFNTKSAYSPIVSSITEDLEALFDIGASGSNV